MPVLTPSSYHVIFFSGSRGYHQLTSICRIKTDSG